MLSAVKILFTSSMVTSFIREDLALLRKHHDVDHLITRGVFAPFAVFLRFLRADLSYTWFASVYSFAVVLSGRLLGKPTIVVIGGVDASREPEIGYGIWLSRWKSVLVRWAMRNATRLLVVDPYFIGQVRSLAAYDAANVRYVPTGYDALLWSPAGRKEQVVLTVAACHDRERMRKKGLDVLFRTAALMPRTSFVVAGIMQTVLADARAEAPPNVTIHSFVDRAELLALYRRAKVYCQPSYTEGLPNSLCEAMLCGCVPVGSEVGGIPTAIAGVGYLVPRGDVPALAAALAAALDAPPEAGGHARARIASEFPLERREREVLAVLGDVTA